MTRLAALLLTLASPLYADEARVAQIEAGRVGSVTLDLPSAPSAGPITLSLPPVGLPEDVRSALSLSPVDQSSGGGTAVIIQRGNGNRAVIIQR